VATAGLAALLTRQRVGVLLVVALAAGVVSGGMAGARRDAVLSAQPGSGPVRLAGVAATDPRGVADGGVMFALDARWSEQDGAWMAWRGPPRLAVLSEPVALAAGEPVIVEGVLGGGPARLGRTLVGGRVRGGSVVRLGPAPGLLMRTGNVLRARVLGVLDAGSASPSGALLSGFLVGAVDDLPDADFEALRRSGLSHFVAVSGSNVALFLAGWWLVAGPLGWGPRRRAVLGLAGVAIFVVVTRWEPSVVRAGAMAGVVLAGRLAGVTVSPWTALGTAVTGSLVVSGGLVADLGMQLSVAATAGILLGAPLWIGRRPRWAWTALGATLAAQAAVAPILLFRFGSVPLLAPVTNLVAAPVVAFATTVGGIGVALGAEPLVAVARTAAGVVLAVARTAGDLPQIGWAGTGLLAGGALLARWRRARPWVAGAVTVTVAALLVPTSGVPSGPEAVFLDIGQGDATLLRGPGGEVILVDGGPDPLLLAERLRGQGVDHIDLLVVSHRHSDHAGGLDGITDRVLVGTAWLPPQLGEGPVLDGLYEELVGAGVEVRFPVPGTTATLGGFGVEVLSPRRRYASPNDGSLVLMVRAGGASVLMAGDIEAFAQAELGPIVADVMKVPHQGAATSDPGWLAASAPQVAVISVGPNDYGHPSSEVIGVLEASGAVVLRTDLDGTVSIDLAGLARSGYRPAG
jgi:competence protein ComEC